MNTKKMVMVLGTVVLLGSVIAVVVSKRSSAKAASKFAYVSESVVQGDVVSTISASGTIEPEELIDVGSQVSGQILEFGRDEKGNDIDYCSVVTNGMLLAKIDDVTYRADLNVARAQLKNAQAGVVVAQANLQQAQAERRQCSRDWDRAQHIGVGNALSQSAYDGYEAAFESAKATVSVSEASIQQAEASVVQAQASLEKAQRNLSYCSIMSPVDGVVIDRRVNRGQTVVSSMSASSLFLIAKDLKKVQIWVAVNEADIGQIKVGMPVSFTVDTFPDLSFRGTVKRIRLNATITSNVVTYTVEVETDNSDGTLLPYLTANIEFETARAANALVVPVRALRWHPAGTSLQKASATEGVVQVLGPDGTPTPIPVKILLTNGTEAAIEADEIRPGMKVVTGTTAISTGTSSSEAAATSGEAAPSSPTSTNNPFLPKMPKPPKFGGPPH